jgi:hypothetical protein
VVPGVQKNPDDARPAPASREGWSPSGTRREDAGVRAAWKAGNVEMADLTVVAASCRRRSWLRHTSRRSWLRHTSATVIFEKFDPIGHPAYNRADCGRSGQKYWKAENWSQIEAAVCGLRRKRAGTLTRCIPLIR